MPGHFTHEIIVKNSAPAERVKRTRKGGPRSKTGCVTCRLRRVKCDETKPTCVRCVNAGRNCEGYPSIFAATKPWEVVVVPSIGSIIKPSTNPRVSSNDHATQSFKFFEKVTVGKLVEAFGTDLWTDAVPRAALHSPAIWHAAIALGSAHEAHLMKNIGNDLHVSKVDWTFEQYNRAIRSLTRPTAQGERPPLDVMIVASILFMGFEMLRREPGRAIGHAKSGMRMFCEYRRQLTGSDQPAYNQALIPLDQLERSLRHVEIQLCELTLDHYPPYPLPVISVFDREARPNCFSPRPAASASFSNLAEARLELEWLAQTLMDRLHFDFGPHLSGPVSYPECPEGQRAMYYRAVMEWSEKFSKLVDDLNASTALLTSLERGLIAWLQMYELLFLQLLETYHSQDEMAWDRLTDRFERILALCMITASNNQFGDPACDLHKVDAYCGFQVGNGIVAACFHVIWKCRTARVRLKGLELLKSYPRRECLWDAQVVIKVGEHLDELERGPIKLHEAAARDAGADEIPAWARVRSIGVKFGHIKRVAELTFVKPRGPTDSSLIEIKRSIDW